MDAIRIRGGKPLHGIIPISGAKNAALPILCATLLSDGESLLRNVPRLRDIDTSAALLRFLGRGVEVDTPLVKVAAGSDVRPEAPYELVKQMRGFAYYVVEKNGAPVLVPNKLYKEVQKTDFGGIPVEQ